MGIWGDVYLISSGPVNVRYPQVVTHFPDQSLTEARVTVRAQLHNATANPIDGVLEAKFDGIRVWQHVALKANETRSVDFAPEQFPELQINHFHSLAVLLHNCARPTFQITPRASPGNYSSSSSPPWGTSANDS
jgi:hypothetical protein